MAIVDLIYLEHCERENMSQKKSNPILHYPNAYYKKWDYEIEQR